MERLTQRLRYTGIATDFKMRREDHHLIDPVIYYTVTRYDDPA